MAAMSDPRLAIVIPVFRHSVLMVDAVESALAQDAPFGIRILIVNDGCPHPETEEIGQALARAHPDRITYLRKANGGLSSARNHGIAHVLAHLPSVEAIYMLDADNALRPLSMARAMAALEADPAAGWIYPDIDMVGLASGHDYSGPYSVLLHLAMNTCEAGSLIRRAVFEAGVSFDTTFKAGFEDWDFFLSAVGAGFRGKTMEGFGFLYRKRPESMLADSEREREPILAKLRAKHRALFSPRAMLRLEQEEAPRYAFVLADLAEVWLTTDPLAPAEVLSFEDYTLRFWQAQVAPGRAPLPPLTVVTKSEVLAEAASVQMLHGLLWQMECMLDQVHLAGLRGAEAAGDRLAIGLLPEGLRGADEAALLMITTDLLMASSVDRVGSWMGSLTSATPQPRFALAELRLPFAPVALGGGGAATALLDLVARLRNAPWAEGARSLRDWRSPDLARRALSHHILRRRFGQQPVLPMLRGEGRHIGLVLSILEFGGVEKVALNFARAFAARGWSVHLFLLGTRDAAITAEWRETLASITFLADPEFAAWGGGERSYFGTEIPRWAAHGNHPRLIALLHWLDAVIDLHSGAAVAVMSQLKKQGVVTVTSLHLADLSPMGRPTGNPFLTLAYEHAFDLFTPCSLALGDWLHAMGIPEDKIVPAPNAASFPIASDRLAGLLAERRAPERLRALYLGRLDAQKGLERLGEVIAASAHLPIDWTVIGKAILTEGAPPLPPSVAAVLRPALSTPEELTAAYAEADVLVLLSEYEGLPLTILEAMRQGVVPIATDVGAVSEVVAAETGVLLPLETAVEGCLAALEDLAFDQARLGRLSRAAAEAMAGRDWLGATEGLAQAIDRVAAKRQVAADADLPPPAHVAPLSAGQEAAPSTDLTPAAWSDLPMAGGEIGAYEPFAGFVQFGAPDGAETRAVVRPHTVRRRDGRAQRILSLKAEGQIPRWFTWELVLSGVDLREHAVLDWRLRYALGRPRNLWAQFMLDGGGEHVQFDIGTLRGTDAGTEMTFPLALRQIPPETLARLTTVRLVLSTDGELLPFDLLAFSVQGRG
jgi:glycosyltransferase involved in cell wall biosynthesis